MKVLNDQKRLRPGIKLPNTLWRKIRILAFEEGVKAEDIVERFLAEGIRKREGSP